MKRIHKKNSDDLALYLFHQGTNFNAYQYLGAHFTSQDTVTFRVWAPNADSVSVVGDFNNWDKHANFLNRINEQGVYQGSISGVKEYDKYKFCIFN